MMSGPLPAACAKDELADRYEELRRQVLDESWKINRGPGLALLIQQGMKPWMDAWSVCPAALTPASAQPVPCKPVIASDSRGEMVMILVAMALHPAQESNQ